MLAVIGIAAALVGHASAGSARTAADLRAAHGVDLLVTMGPHIPDLTQSLARGLSPAATRELDGAVIARAA